MQDNFRHRNKQIEQSALVLEAEHAITPSFQVVTGIHERGIQLYLGFGSFAAARNSLLTFRDPDG
jgi:hypothetical protein